jgi:hypothetical protein
MQLMGLPFQRRKEEYYPYYPKKTFRHTLHSRIRTRKRWAQAEEPD